MRFPVGDEYTRKYSKVSVASAISEARRKSSQGSRGGRKDSSVSGRKDSSARKDSSGRKISTGSKEPSSAVVLETQTSNTLTVPV